MPSPELSHRHQKAVLWPATGVDDYGEPTRGDAVELDVRWNKTRTQTVDSQGSPIALDATVVVDRAIVVGSNMWQGELADWYGTGSLGDDSEVMEVMIYKETKDIRGREIRRTVGLRKYKDTPAEPT